MNTDKMNLRDAGRWDICGLGEELEDTESGGGVTDSTRCPPFAILVTEVEPSVDLQCPHLLMFVHTLEDSSLRANN